MVLPTTGVSWVVFANCSIVTLTLSFTSFTINDPYQPWQGARLWVSSMPSLLTINLPLLVDGTIGHIYIHVMLHVHAGLCVTSLSTAHSCAPIYLSCLIVCHDPIPIIGCRISKHYQRTIISADLRSRLTAFTINDVHFISIINGW